MQTKLTTLSSCLLIFTSLSIFPIEQILGQQPSPTSSQPSTVAPDSGTEPSTTAPDSETKPKAPQTSSEFSQLPCDKDQDLKEKDQDLSSSHKDEGKPTWETGIYKYYGKINPKTNEANGRGLMVFKHSNYRYYGDFKNNKRNGCGILYFPVESNIIYYLGQFKNDKLQGLGYLKLNKEKAYRGNFANNKCQGEGVYITEKNVELARGIWKEDMLQGRDDNFSCKNLNDR